MGAGPPGRESADSVELGGGPEPTLSFRVSWGLLSSPSSEAVRTALPFPAPTCTSVLCFCGSTTQEVLKPAHPSQLPCSLGNLPLSPGLLCGLPPGFTFHSAAKVTS